MENSNEGKLVARLAGALAVECGIHPETVGRIKKAAELHDIGKNALPECIVGKPGKHTADESMVMKAHTLSYCLINCNVWETVR